MQSKSESRSFIEEYRIFIENLSNLLLMSNVPSELVKIFEDAKSKYNGIIETFNLEQKNTGELFGYLAREMNFFNQQIMNSGMTQPKKWLDIARVILESIGKHISHWIVGIIDEILHIASALVPDAKHFDEHKHHSK